MPKGDKLPIKQLLFIKEYLIDKNATQAYIRAGYNGKGAEVSACQLLRKPKVKAIIDAELNKTMNELDITGVPYKKVSEVPKDTKVKEVVKEPQEILKLTRARKMPEVVPVKSKPSVEKWFEWGIIKWKTDTAFDKSMSNRWYEISDINSSKWKIWNKYVKTLPNGQKIEVLYTYKTQNWIDDWEIILKIREKNWEVDWWKSYIDKWAFANDLISFETVPVKTKEQQKVKIWKS